MRRQGHAIDVFHGDKRDELTRTLSPGHGLLEGLYRGDVRMFQAGGGQGLTPKTGEAVGVVAHGRRQDFERHLALQRGVLGKIDLTHAAFSELADDTVVAYGLVWGYSFSI